MTAHPGFWSQLYGKSVDIAANTIRGLILLALTVAGFFIRRKLDLRHRANIQRQEARIAKEIEAEERDKERQGKLSQFRTERDELSRLMRRATQLSEINSIWGDYTKWLNKHKFCLNTSNDKRYYQAQAIFAKFELDKPDEFLAGAKHLADAIDETDITLRDESVY